MSEEEKKPEEMTIEELTEQINNYNENLSQINTLIEENQNNKEELNNLLELKKNVENAIVYYTKLKEAKFKENKDKKIIEVTIDSIGKLCEVADEENENNLNGIIQSVDLTNKSCEVRILGLEPKIMEFPFNKIKMNKEIKDNEIFIGMLCEYYDHEEDTWNKCKIISLTKDGIKIKLLNKSNMDLIIKQKFLRLTDDIDKKNKKIKKNKEILKNNEINNLNNEDKIGIFENEDTQKRWVNFVIPEKFKLKPNDTEETKLLKRKRVKKLKYNYKQKEIEEITANKQLNWINFSKKLKK